MFQKKKIIRTAKSSYSNTKVIARNLLTNVSYRRYKQQDFNNASFAIDILSFLVQNFNQLIWIESLTMKIKDCM